MRKGWLATTSHFGGALHTATESQFTDLLRVLADVNSPRLLDPKRAVVPYNDVRARRQLIVRFRAGRPKAVELREQLRQVASEVIDAWDEEAAPSGNEILAEVGFLAWQRHLGDFRERYPASVHDPDSFGWQWRPNVIRRVRKLIGEDVKVLQMPGT
jgi:hypothetical protein